MTVLVNTDQFWTILCDARALPTAPDTVYRCGVEYVTLYPPDEAFLMQKVEAVCDELGDSIRVRPRFVKQGFDLLLKILHR
jgi:hypothetical protein